VRKLFSIPGVLGIPRLWRPLWRFVAVGFSEEYPEWQANLFLFASAESQLISAAGFGIFAITNMASVADRALGPTRMPPDD
jgi:hypothetical protein